MRGEQWPECKFFSCFSKIFCKRGEGSHLLLFNIYFLHQNVATSTRWESTKPCWNLNSVYLTYSSLSKCCRLISDILVETLLIKPGSVLQRSPEVAGWEMMMGSWRRVYFYWRKVEGSSIFCKDKQTNRLTLTCEGLSCVSVSIVEWPGTGTASARVTRRSTASS